MREVPHPVNGCAQLRLNGKMSSNFPNARAFQVKSIVLYQVLLEVVRRITNSGNMAVVTIATTTMLPWYHVAKPATMR
jgi:hypothetical protein